MSDDGPFDHEKQRPSCGFRASRICAPSTLLVLDGGERVEGWDPPRLQGNGAATSPGEAKKIDRRGVSEGPSHASRRDRSALRLQDPLPAFHLASRRVRMGAAATRGWARRGRPAARGAVVAHTRTVSAARWVSLTAAPRAARGSVAAARSRAIAPSRKDVLQT